MTDLAIALWTTYIAIAVPGVLTFSVLGLIELADFAKAYKKIEACTNKYTTNRYTNTANLSKRRFIWFLKGIGISFIWPLALWLYLCFKIGRALKWLVNSLWLLWHYRPNG